MSRLLDFNYRYTLIVCGIIVGVYAILFQVVARTGMIEHLMAMNFRWWEFVLVAGFIVFRLLAYLMVPAVVVALGVHALARRVLGG